MPERTVIIAAAMIDRPNPTRYKDELTEKSNKETSKANQRNPPYAKYARGMYNPKQTMSFAMSVNRASTVLNINLKTCGRATPNKHPVFIVL